MTRQAPSLPPPPAPNLLANDSVPDEPKPKLGRPPKYPWDTWLATHPTGVDFHAHVLLAGREFDCETESMIAQIRRRAAKADVDAQWVVDQAQVGFDPRTGAPVYVDRIVLWVEPEDEE